MTSVFCLCSYRHDQPDPAKLSATSTKEETEKVKLTSRPHRLSHMRPDLHCGVPSPGFLQIRHKVGEICLSVLSRQREETM